MPSIRHAKSIEIRKLTNSIIILESDYYHFSCFWPALSESDFRMFTISVITASESGVSPRTSRRSAMKKSLTKYTNLLFHSTPKFARHLKR